MEERRDHFLLIAALMRPSHPDIKLGSALVYLSFSRYTMSESTALVSFISRSAFRLAYRALTIKSYGQIRDSR